MDEGRTICAGRLPRRSPPSRGRWDSVSYVPQVRAVKRVHAWATRGTSDTPRLLAIRSRLLSIALGLRSSVRRYRSFSYYCATDVCRRSHPLARPRSSSVLGVTAQSGALVRSNRSHIFFMLSLRISYCTCILRMNLLSSSCPVRINPCARLNCPHVAYLCVSS